MDIKIGAKHLATLTATEAFMSAMENGLSDSSWPGAMVAVSRYPRQENFLFLTE
jgi:hypothetical protein